MSSIDRRVVEAQFDNRQFEQGVRTTLSSLDNLKKGLNMDGASRGLDGLASATGRVSNGLNVMRVAAYTAIATIAHQATIAGEQFVRSFTVGPLLDGLHEYETQLGSIQTILSNTQWQHTTLKDVNAALAQLNHYSDKTIYNFGEMARNIGTFTAAGVKLDTSVNAIKGIANLAAVSGSNAQQASTAMYQLSQALSAGSLKLMDWNSVVNAGMGGKIFQDALMETARVHGVAIDKMVKKQGSFRNTLQEGWLTSKVLTETLAKFTGDESREQLKQQGYTEKQIDSIIKLGKMATDAATKVKTGTQLINTLQETAGSGWAKTWQIVIGNFNEAKDLWTGVNNVVGGALTKMANARNKVLADWKDLGGRDAMLDGIKAAFEALMSVIKPIKDAFREIFPAKTGQQLYDMTVAVRDFMENLKIGAGTAENLKRTFAGFFAVLDIGWQVVKAGIKFIADLFGAVTEGQGSGGFLGATASIGDFLVALDKAIKNGEGLTKFFQGLEHILAGPIRLLRAVADAIFSIFDFNAPSADAITGAFSPVEALGQTLSKVWDNLIDIFSKVFGWAAKVGSAVAHAFAGMGTAISDAMGGLNFDDVLNTINTGLLAGLLLLFKKFVSHFTSSENGVGGLIEAVKGPFVELTGTLQQMQNTLRATTLLQIAAAVGILAASVVALSTVDAAGLTRALTAIAALFTQLFISLALFSKVGGAQGLVTTSTGLILFATAIRVLTTSVKALAELSWGELVKGLVGVTALIGGLILATQGIAGNAGGMVRAGAGIILLAAGIKVLVSSVTDLSGLSWGEMAKGLTGVAAILVALALYSKFAGANGAGVLSGAGIILLAAGIKILASAVKDFGDLAWGSIAKGLVSLTAILAVFGAFSKSVGNPVTLVASGVALILVGHAMTILAKAVDKFGNMAWGTIAKGLVSMAGALTLIALAMNAMPPSSILSAVAILGVSVALGKIADALGQMGGMSWGEIAKGLVTLAGALAIIAVAMYGMTGTLAGAAATLVVAAALRVLTPVLTTLGGMSWTEIGKGLVTLAGAFAVIGLAGLVLTPIVPTLLGLGAAIALIGAGVALAGAGVLLLATGITALAVAGTAGTAAVIGLVSGILGILPQVGKALAGLLVGFSLAIAKASPAIIKGLVTVLDSLLDAIIIETPKIIKAFDVILMNLLKELEKAVPRIAETSLKMILGILEAIDRQAPKIITAVEKMIVDMLHALADGIPEMVDAGVAVIVAYLHGIARNIDDIIDAGVRIVAKLIRGIGDASLHLIDVAAQTLLQFLHGLADAIRLYEPELMQAGWDIAAAIVEGFWNGLKGGLGGLFGKVANIFGGVTDVANQVYETHSPSKVFWRIGKWVAVGLAGGIEAFSGVAKEASRNMALAAIEGATKEFHKAAKFVTGDNFLEGLVGGKDEVKNTIQYAMDLLHDALQRSHSDMQQLNQDLKELKKNRDDDNKSVRDATEAVSDNKNKLNELQNAKKLDHDAILQAQRDLRDSKEALDEAKKARKEHEQAIKDDTKALAAATDEHERARAAYDELNDRLDKQKQKLKDLGKEYDAETEKLNAANQALADAISLRDNYNNQITDQYSALPDITDETTVDDFTKGLSDQVDNTQTFIDDLNQLRDQFHISDELYQELLAKGPDILPFVEQLITGGQAAVDQINLLTDQLTAEAAALGATASASLYQAGVDAAQGVVDGIKKKRKDIREEMEKIADIIAKAIRHALKIKSPSQVMHEIGQYIGDGLVAGMRAMEDGVDKQGKKLVDKMNAYINQLNEMLSKGETLTPTITPVLDLSGIKSGAAQISGIIKPISVMSTLSNAGQAASGVNANMAAVASKVDKPVAAAVRDVTFIQNNTSPKALTTAEIYRQTNNQISLAKGALAKDAA